MENIKEIIRKNIITLRKKQGLTQIDLAKQINFSDKAVSRWEKGEVVPDIETLQSLSNVFEVPLSYMIEEHNYEKEEKHLPNKNELLLHFTSLCSIWILIIVAFVYLKLIYNYTFWQLFVWGVPATLVCTLIANKKWGNNILKTILQSTLLWSLITCFYLQFLSQNLWLIFLIGIPIQATILLKLFITKKPKRK